MIKQKQLGNIENIADLATTGTIAFSGVVRSEDVRIARVTQTTASVVISLPDPIDLAVFPSVKVVNIGTASFTMHGVILSVNSFATFVHNGTVWAADAAPNSLGLSPEVLIPTAQNVVPTLAASPSVGSFVRFYVNGVFEQTGITSDAVGSITVLPATLGYNIEVIDEVVAHYFV